MEGELSYIQTIVCSMENQLIKFASAYSGLTNKEIKELDTWIRKNTIEKFGLYDH